MLTGMSRVKTILVTGCTGLVGHGICYFLLNQGYQVIGTTRKSIHSLHSKFRVHQLDLKDIESVERLRDIVSETDVFIHNAAIIPHEARRTYSREQGLELFEVNFLATYRILKILAEYPHKKFVYISGTRLAHTISDSVLEDMPFATTDEYATSKLCGELLCRQFMNQSLPHSTILRISAPYGYNINSDAVIPRFMKQAQAGQNIELWGTGNRKQVFTFVEDIGRVCELVSQKDVPGVFNITGGASVTMKELSDTIVRSFPGTTSKVVMTGKPDLQEGMQVTYAIEKAKRVLGYEPQYDIVSGIKKIVENIKEPTHVKIFE